MPRVPKTVGPAQPNQSLIAGLECLFAVAAAAEPVGSRELSRQLNMEPTRINRLLKTLGAAGFVRQNAERRYQPGTAMHVMAAVAMHGSRLLRVALPVISRLMRQTGHPAALGVLWRGRVSYLYHGGDVVGGIAGHEAFPAAQSSIGKALLAGADADEVKTAAAVANMPVAALKRELAGVRCAGYAVDERRDAGSFAVAIGQPAIAAVALIHGPGFAETDIAALRAAADTIGGLLDA